MPFYEYDCTDCGATFERRLRVDERNTPQPCPHCGEEHASLRMSLPALVGAAAPTASMGTCPTTGSACGCAHAARN
jgi:putative FmdB family regulatory protein